MSTLKHLLCLIPWIILISCNKNSSENTSTPAPYHLSYGDSVFYIRNQSADVMASPKETRSGTFTAFPDGLSIDRATGTINVSQSEAGMRYRIRFESTAGDSSICYILISGINFPDRFYRMENADSVAFPVYNADPSSLMPSGSFDDDKVANNSGCAMRTNNGQINLAESIRKGLFGTTPKNDTRKDFEIKYRLDDPSGKALNKIKILLYYYDRMSDVPQDLQQTMQEHLAMTLQTNNIPINNSPLSISVKRPRPPCIVVIGHNN